MSPRRVFHTIVLVTTLVSPAIAQVPEGDAVVGTYFDQTVPNVPGSPGLYIVSLPDGKVTPITGLPKELTTKGTYSSGIWAVALRSSDGAILAAPIGVGPIYLYVFYLKGSAVDQTRSKKVFLGVATKGVAAVSAGLMPDDRTYVGAGQQDATGKIHFLDNGPMSTSAVAIVDDSLSTPTVTPVLGLPTPSGAPKVSSDRVFFPTERYYYLLYNDYVWYHPSSSSSLWRFDLQTKTVCSLASWPGAAAVGMTVDDDGTIYVSTTGILGTPVAALHHIHTITPDGCKKPKITSVQTVGNATVGTIITTAMAMDRRSGRMVVSSIDGGPTFPATWANTLAYVDPVSGKSTKITSGPAGGWSRTSFGGLAVNNIMESYGPASEGANRYYFENFPNPGGQPTVGDPGFWLTSHATPDQPLASVLLVSAGRGDTKFLGTRILTDFGSTTVVPMSAASTARIPLPIPNNPVLKGLVFNVQTFHAEKGGQHAASRGLTLEIQ